jgi:predicted nucleic acid-binding protein
MSTIDAFLSATAEVHRLQLVTRNVSDFPTLKTFLNPWS